MTESEWLSSSDPTPMLEFLRGKASDRKLILFCLAYLTAEMAPDTNQEYRARMEVAMRYADGYASVEILREHWGRIENTWPERAHEWAFELVSEASESLRHAKKIARTLRCIFNPFALPLDPRWQTPTVLALAQAIYTDRAFDRLPILADALEEASCDNPDLLNHCRSETVHTRGCFAIDLLLGKE
ncbi:hypothetical protein [Fimbriiglobus ruber]|uniref:hypothetical protein n=1 Tax=Fimbriiglobus ruber TaxID=1908690 RepID=UPI001EE6A975|nr:hypothetical protein [Fimbriiglobus ruber]